MLPPQGRLEHGPTGGDGTRTLFELLFYALIPCVEDTSVRPFPRRGNGKHWAKVGAYSNSTLGREASMPTSSFEPFISEINGGENGFVLHLRCSLLFLCPSCVPKEHKGIRAWDNWGVSGEETPGNLKTAVLLVKSNITKAWAMLDLNQRPYGYQPYALTS